MRFVQSNKALDLKKKIEGKTNTRSDGRGEVPLRLRWFRPFHLAIWVREKEARGRGGCVLCFNNPTWINGSDSTRMRIDPTRTTLDPPPPA